MTERRQSASQTAGPYVHIGCLPNAAGIDGIYGGRDPGSGPCKLIGQAMTLTGTLLDGDDAPVSDAMLEFWQPDGDGCFSTDGWARRAVDQNGRFELTTVLPGHSEGSAPHIKLWIAARGINMGLHTRIYFTNADDPVLRLAGDRATTMIAKGDGTRYHLDIHLQGPKETVFLNV